MTRTLIVNADDLGMASGVNRGILEAHLAGIVTSSTVMANMPAATAGIELVRREAPSLGLGLHVNLTYGRPLTAPDEVPSLVRPDGTFVSVSRGLGLPHNWNRRDIEAEVSAQLQRFVDLAGRLPDHLDAHQLVSSLSRPCRAVVLDVAAQHGLPVRRGRTGWFGPFERWVSEVATLPDALVPVLDRLPRPWRQRPMDERTPLSTDGLELRFFGARATTDTLLEILSHLPQGVTELVCHPGRSGGRQDDYPYREAELAALTDPRVAAKVRDEAIVLATFANLATSRAPEWRDPLR